MRNVYTILAQELKGMSGGQHFWYWAFPLALLSLLMYFFFSGVPILVDIVNPRMLNPEMNKEWGVLENIQLLIVTIMIAISAYAMFRKKPVLQKIGFGLITVFAIFVFLEEIDYGAHFSQYFSGVHQSQLEKLTGIYNLHNTSAATARISKRIVYLLMLITFIIAPLLKINFRSNIVNYLIPHPKIMILAFLTIFLEIIARLLVPLNNLELDDLGMDIGEFSEIMIYYIFLMYLIQLVFEKKWVITGQDNTISA